MARVETTTLQFEIIINGEKKIVKTMQEVKKERAILIRQLNTQKLTQEEYNQKIRELQKLNSILADHRKKMRGVGEELKKTASLADKAKDALKQIGAAIAGAFVFDAIKNFGLQMFKASASLEQYRKKSETVFGQGIKDVERFAAANARAMGLTRQEYINAATEAGDLLIPMGFQREEATKLSTDLLNLSGALSEWTGGQRTSKEVSEILTKALLGEREELKGLGIAISEADVQTRLAAKGQKELTGQALEQAKALATLELIVQKSTDAQTAFANNSNSLLRRQAQLNATFKDIRGTLANALIPAFTSMLELVVDLTGAEQKQSDVLEEERLNLNALVLQITDTNTSNEERTKLIDKLNTQYPTFLENLDQETVTNAQLRDRLKEVNEQLVNRIIIQQRQEEIDEEAAKLASQKNTQLDREFNLRKKLADIANRFNLTIQEEATLLEQATDLREQLLDKSVKFTQLFSRQQDLKSLRNYIIAIENGADYIEEGEGRLADLTERRNALMEELGISLDEVTTKANEFNSSLNAADNFSLKIQKLKDDIKEAAEELGEIDFFSDAFEDRDADAAIQQFKEEAEKELEIHQQKLEKKKEAEERAATFIAQAEDTYRQEQVEKEREAIQKRAQLFDQYASGILSLASSINDFEQAKDDERLAQIEKQKKRELRLAGDNEEKKQKIEEKFDRQKERLERAAARRKQNISSIQTIINTAQSIVKTGADLGYPAAIPFQILAGAIGALNLATINRQRFRKGTKLPVQKGKGGLPQGPSHEQNGISLIDDHGNYYGEMEGGELILSKAFTNNNPQLTDYLLNISQNENGRRLGGHLYQDGGILQTASTTPSQAVVENTTTAGFGALESKLDQLINVASQTKFVSLLGEKEARLLGEMLDEMNQDKANRNF